MTSEEAWNVAEKTFEDSNLRSSEVTYYCLPATSCSKQTTTSLAVLDVSDRVRGTALQEMLTMLLVVILLSFFVHTLTMGASRFTTSLFRPLKILTDDIKAMSSLEIVHIDEDLQLDAMASESAEELQHLQAAFNVMRSAVRSWSKYVPPFVVQRLFDAGIEAKIGVAKCNATILFCDIDGFEEICRDIPPKSVLSLLNQVLGKIADIIELCQGTLLEFIGDEVLAVFNTPTHIKDHLGAAGLACVEIHRAMRSLPSLCSSGTEFQIKCRCGIHNADILAGNVGSVQRMKYGLLGDGVNLTARLKGLTSRYQARTLASETILRDERFKQHFLYRPVDLVAVKGKKEPTTVYEVMGLRKDDESAMIGRLAQAHIDAFKMYQDRRFADAKNLFQTVISSLETTETIQPSRSMDSQCGGPIVAQLSTHSAALMVKRCTQYLKDPPPENWDGVDRLSKKTFEPVEAKENPRTSQEAASSNAPAVASQGISALSLPAGPPSLTDPRTDRRLENPLDALDSARDLGKSSDAAWCLWPPCGSERCERPGEPITDPAAPRS